MKIILKKTQWFTVITILCLVAVTFIVAGGCYKPEILPTNSPSTCNFDNPLTDLPWLKEKIDGFNLLAQENQNLPIAIYQCKYGSKEIGFLIDAGNTKPFYNCEGEILCIMGGFAGETCSDLNIVSQELIWEKNYSVSIWECVLEHFNTTITLTIDDYTNLVSVSKFPKESDNDCFHQFRDGNQYIFTTETPYLVPEGGLYLEPLESNVYCAEPTCSFSVTKISDNEIRLKYLGGVWLGANYMSEYLFKKL